jgi:AmmeMemoRadiSam system protein B
MSISIQEIRPAAHAGTMYPADPGFLRKVVDGFLAAEPAPGRDLAGRTELPELPKAIIVPHGGYVFSGKVAGSAFAGWRGQSTGRVVIIGPTHSYDFPGIALPDTSVFATPLGELQVDREAVGRLERFNFVRRFEAAHHLEHSIEVQLPFVQQLFGNVAIVPLITGRVETRQVASALEAVWGGPETVFVISSDLSQFQTHEVSSKMDRSTARAIQEFRSAVITVDQACGYRAIRGFLQVAGRREMRCELKEMGHSGEVSTDNLVTGYGAFQFFDL